VESIRPIESALVSVVIPFYNRRKTLARALDSVAAQSYPNWEVVLVDDGSTDRSIDVAKDYAARFPGQIRVFRQQNGGPGVARNTGIAASRGSFVAFLDSDDQWKPVFIDRVLAAFHACPDVDWVYTNVSRTDEHGNAIIPSVFDDERSGPFRSLKTRRCQHLNIIEDPAFLETAIRRTVKEGANSMVRRSVFDRVSYHPTIRFGEDRLLTMLAIGAGFKFGYIDEVLMTKYHHGENISMIDDRDVDQNLRSMADRIKGLEYIQRTLQLGRREELAVRARISEFYLECGRVMIDGRRGLIRPVPYLVRAVLANPDRASMLYVIGRKIRNRLTRKREPALR